MPYAKPLTPDEQAELVAQAWAEIEPEIVRRDGLRLGTSAEAGRLCVTGSSKRGVQRGTYRRMREWPTAPAPWPKIDPQTVTDDNPRGWSYKHPRTGDEMYDLDEVDRWNRTGRQPPGKWWTDLERPTPDRFTVMTAINNGEITHEEERITPTGSRTRMVLLVKGERPEKPRPITRVVNDYDKAGYVELGKPGEKLRLTDTGRELMQRWADAGPDAVKPRRPRPKRAT